MFDECVNERGCTGCLDLTGLQLIFRPFFSPFKVYRVPGFDRVTATSMYYAMAMRLVYRVPGFDRVTAKKSSSGNRGVWCTGCLDLTGLQRDCISRLC